MTGGRLQQRPGSPTAVLLAPLMPALAGNGLAMRAGVLLEALACEHRVTLWVVPVASGGVVADAGRWVRSLAERVVVTVPEEDPAWRLAARLRDPAERRAALEAFPRPALARFATSRPVAELRHALGGQLGEEVRRLVVLRSYLAPFALPLASSAASAGEPRPDVLLDLDDDEATTRRRLAELHRLLADADGGVWEDLEAKRFEALERDLLPRVDRLFVAHAGHAESLRRRLGSSGGPAVEVLPNAVSLPPEGLRRPPGPELRLLLVGNLSYLPNQDAAERLVREVLPEARRLVDRPVQVRLVGSRPPPAISSLGEVPGVEVWADVPDLAPHYAWADVVAVPLRAGGGTRIKLLEAFAYRVPVVSTPLGAEGLEVEAERHLLVATTPRETAVACGRLAGEPGLRARLVREARSLVERRYARDLVVDELRRMLAGQLP